MNETESGLRYLILEESTSDRQPQKGQVVTVHYTGWLDDGSGNPGKEFDSSRKRGQPFSFIIGAGQVIKGWDEGVLSMKIKEKRRLIIPPELGYGQRGAAGVIPGGATLIFDVELLNAE